MRYPATCLLALVIGQADAQTPAERAGQLLDRELGQDRTTGAAVPSGAVTPPAASTAVQAIDQDRRSLAPDVGRPEAAGITTPGPAGSGETGGPNPQR